MSAIVAERFVDVIVEDGWLANPSDLLSSLRKPAGRQPAPSSIAVSEALSSLDDDKALTIIKAALDAAYFSIFSLFDAGFKNSGISMEIVSTGEFWVSDDHRTVLYETYRDRVEPNGFVRKPS